MNTYLNERQQKIFNDLKSTKTPITAKTLSIKYKVSLRTIRNDIDLISELIKDIDGKIIKVPRIGMRIIDGGDKSLDDLTKTSSSLDNFVYVDDSRQLFMIFAYFLVNENPITTDRCIDIFKISKGTFLSRVKDLNECLKEARVHLRGIKNKGFYLDADKKGILETYEYFRDKILSKGMYDILFENDDLIDNETKKEIAGVLRYIENDLSLSIQHYRTLNNLLGFFIKIKRKNTEKYKNTISSDHHDKSYSIAQYFLVELKTILTDNDLTFVDYLLDKCTDINEGDIKKGTFSLLEKATDAMIEDAISQMPELAEDRDNLKIDIIKHIQSTLARNNLGVANSNQLLNQIKARFPILFNVVKSSSRAFLKLYPFTFNDDEIGYLTLYFRRSIEKTEKIKDAKVIVICNTGRGASKLLAARIMNNLPEIHIVAILSSDELDTMTPILDDIDLIISTMQLGDIKKPYIVVSPFLSDEELQMIKEAVFIGSDPHSSFSNYSLNELVTALVSQYVTSDKVSEFTHKMYSLTSDYSLERFAGDEFEIVSEVAVEVMVLCGDLYPNGIKNKDFNRIAGILAHVFMSIPRWSRSEFIKAQDYDELVQKYRSQYQKIERFIIKMEEMLGITIDRIEIIAILRYII